MNDLLSSVARAAPQAGVATDTGKDVALLGSWYHTVSNKILG